MPMDFPNPIRVSHELAVLGRVILAVYDSVMMLNPVVLRIRVFPVWARLH